LCKLHLSFFHFADKTVKLWKIGERQLYASHAAHDVETGVVTDVSKLPLPAPINASMNDLGILSSTYAYLRRSYGSGHNYHIHSLSVNSDGATFLSADDLTVNIWDIERNDCCFSKLFNLVFVFIYLFCNNADIIDIKPDSMENLNEVITCGKYHPHQCNLLAYSTSRGAVNLCDLRVSALINSRHYCDNDCSSNSFSSSFETSNFCPLRPDASPYDSCYCDDSSCNQPKSTTVFRCAVDKREINQYSELISSISDMK